MLASKVGVRRPIGGGKVNKLDRTCIDSDDDDYEFEDAKQEEDIDNKNNTSAYMISRGNVNKYQNN